MTVDLPVEPTELPATQVQAQDSPKDSPDDAPAADQEVEPG
jgi:hypothetical protein